MAILVVMAKKEVFELSLATHVKDVSSNSFRVENFICVEEFPTPRTSQELQDLVSCFIEKSTKSLSEGDSIYGACFSIAGPVFGKQSARIKIDSKNTLEITSEGIGKKLAFPRLRVALLNDMKAIGYGIFFGDRNQELIEVQPGVLSPRNSGERVEERFLLMLITDGLGYALWHRPEDRSELMPISSEGGHSNFSTSTGTEKLYAKIQQEKFQGEDYSPISEEYFLSVPGLARIHNYHIQTSSDDESSSFGYEDDGSCPFREIAKV